MSLPLGFAGLFAFDHDRTVLVRKSIEGGAACVESERGTDRRRASSDTSRRIDSFIDVIADSTSDLLGGPKAVFRGLCFIPK